MNKTGKTLISGSILGIIAILSVLLVFMTSNGKQEYGTRSGITKIYEYNNVVDNISINNIAEHACENLYPNLSSSTRQSTYNWNSGINPTTIVVEIYPEVKVNDDQALVWFSKDEANVNIWVPTVNGRKTQTVTDESEYNSILNLALKITNQNRGYMVIFDNVQPNSLADNLVGICTPIPFSE